MTPESPESDGPMHMAGRIVASMPAAPRRYVARRLKDSAGLTESEIAGVLGVNQSTVSRDLKATVAPNGRSPGGAPLYPPGRFNEDPGYRERVEVLARDMSQANARLQASREFAGTPLRTPMRNQATDLGPERARIAAELQGAV